MGLKIFYGGLTLLMTNEVFKVVPTGAIVGAILMIVGYVLYLFDK